MKNTVFTAQEIMQLHSDMPNYWLLLEVLRYDKKGRADLLRMIAHSKDKEELRNILLEDDNWNWDRNYIFVCSDPEACDLNKSNT